MDDARTYTWVARPDSARAAARSFMIGAMRRRRWSYVALWLLFGVLLWTSLSEDLSPLARAMWALAFGAVLITCTLAIAFALKGLVTRRRFASRLPPGIELTSHFGPTAVELRGPLSRHELTYDGLVSVERVGGWVHLRQVGSPLPVVWPGALFPDEEIERIRDAIAASSH